MSKVTKKKPNEFLKKLNQFSNKMFEKSTGLIAPNTSEYEDEQYSYNSSAPSSVYIQQQSGTQYVKQSVSFTNAFRAGFFFTLGCMVAGIIPFIIVYMMLMGSLQQQTPKYIQQTPSIEQVVPDQSQDESQPQ